MGNGETDQYKIYSAGRKEGFGSSVGIGNKYIGHEQELMLPIEGVLSLSEKFLQFSFN